MNTNILDCYEHQCFGYWIIGVSSRLFKQQTIRRSGAELYCHKIGHTCFFPNPRDVDGKRLKIEMRPFSDDLRDRGFHIIVTVGDKKKILGLSILRQKEKAERP